MFSMSALASYHLDATELARLGVLQGTEALLPARSVLGLDWPELEAALVTIRTAAERFERLAATLERNPAALLTGAPLPAPGPGEAGHSGD